MRFAVSLILSLGALILSGVTTFLTFFDSRYTLTAAISGVEASMPGGSSFDGSLYNVSFRPGAEVSLILSNRGTRPLVIPGAELLASSSHTACDIAKDALRLEASNFATVLSEANTVQQMRLGFSLPAIDADKAPGAAYRVDNTDRTWCLRLTVFDPAGRRIDADMIALREKMTFTPDAANEYLDSTLNVEHPKGPVKLTSQGLLFY